MSLKLPFPAPYLALLVLIPALAAPLFALFPAYQHWREDQDLRRGHITYVRFPCTAMTVANACPAFTLDVYGDGTVIYQATSGTHVKGSYTYHVDGSELREYLRDLGVSAYWSSPVATGPDRDGGACLIILQMHQETLKNGCLKWQPNTDQAMNDPGVTDTVAQLEALTQVNSMARGDTGTEALLRTARPYKARRKPL